MSLVVEFELLSSKAPEHQIDRAPSPAAQVDEPVLAAGSDELLAAGSGVSLCGLVKRPDLNGVVGVLKEYDAQNERYNVEVRSHALMRTDYMASLWQTDEHGLLGVRRCNLALNQSRPGAKRRRGEGGEGCIGEFESYIEIDTDSCDDHPQKKMA